MRNFIETYYFLKKYYKNNKLAKKIISLRSYQKKLHNTYINEFPNLAVFAFERISLEISLFGMYEKDALINIKKLIFDRKNYKNSYCLDVGGNIGNHSVFFSKFFKKVYSFEPHPLIYNLLNFNTANLNIDTFNYGLSNKNATLSIETNQKTSLGSSKIVNKNTTDGSAYYKSKVIVKKLDDQKFINKLNSRIDFIKIDVENHELEVLEGMNKVLIKHNPIICMEQHSNVFFKDTNNNYTSKSIEYLNQNSYNFFYTIDDTREWKSINIELKIVRNIYKLFQMLIFGIPKKNIRLKIVKKFSKKTYYNLLISKTAIL